MRALPRLFARRYAYEQGPKAGTVTKVYPDPITVEGFEPGPGGPRLGAQEMNELLHVLTEHVANTRYTGLLHWHDRNAGNIDPSSVVFNPADGLTYYTFTTNVRRGTGFDSEDVESSIWSSSLRRKGCVRRDSSGNVGVVLFGGQSSGHRAWITDGTSHRTSDLNNDSTARDVFSAVYDAENGVAIAVGGLSSDAGDRVFMRLEDGDATELEAATSQPSLAQISSSAARHQMLATSGGRVLCFYATNAGQFACYTSRDGGDIWTETAAPSGGTNAQARGIFYEPDFLGQGPAFVAMTRSEAAGFQIFTTQDGSSWSVVDVDAEIAAPLGENSLDGFTLLGDVLFAPVSGSPFVYVVELRLMRAIRSRPRLGNVGSCYFDGARFWTTGDSLISGHVVTPLTADLERMNA